MKRSRKENETAFQHGNDPDHPKSKGEEEAETPPAMTLLDWLRAAGLTGTKEGCAEGDCGACTVVIEAPDGARAPVNACLMTLGQAHGLALRSVEGLSAPDGAPHPVQAAMLAAENHDWEVNRQNYAMFMNEVMKYRIKEANQNPSMFPRASSYTPVKVNI